MKIRIRFETCKYRAIILEKIWRGRYVAESEKAIRARRERSKETSGERKRRYAARARDRCIGGDSRYT